MLGFATTMKGKFRRRCIRCARRAGRSDKVKFADARRAPSDRGGLPCLTRSAKVSGLRGRLASRLISWSDIVALDGRYDHCSVALGTMASRLDARLEVVNSRVNCIYRACQPRPKHIILSCFESHTFILTGSICMPRVVHDRSKYNKTEDRKILQAQGGIS